MKLIFTFFFLIPLFINGQNKEIWFYDGTIKEAQKVSYDTTTVAFLNFKGKTKYEDTKDIFAIISKDDTVYFSEGKTQSENANMLIFLRGKHDGLEYKNNFILGSGVFIGLISPFLLAFSGLPSFISPVISLVYVLTISAINPHKIDVPKDYQKSDIYKKGKTASVKKKRVLLSIYGSIIGLLLGFIAAYFVFEYSKK